MLLAYQKKGKGGKRITGNKLSFLAFFWFLASPFSQGQDTKIFVYDTDSLAVESAEVTYTFDGVTRYEFTDVNGIVTITGIPGHKVILRRIAKVGYIGLGFNLPLKAGEDQYFELESEPAGLNEAVVTVQYKKKSASQAVEKIQVIGKEEIRQMAANNVRDVLQNQLNVRIGQDNSTGTVLSLMGVSGNNVKILVDGVPVIGRLDGNIDLSQLNLNDIERIEVVEGPMSVTYGSNALAGVINLITKKGSAQSRGSLTGYYEKVGYYNFDGSWNGKIGEKTTFRASGGRYFFGGWSPTDEGRFQQWKPKEQYFGRVQFSRTIGKFEVRLKSEAFRELLKSKGKLLAPYYENAFDADFTTYRFNQGLFINRKINDHSSIEIISSYNYFYRRRDKYFNDLVNLEKQLTTGQGDQDTSIFQAFMSRGTYNNYKDRSRLNYQLGYNIRSEKGYGIRLKTESGEAPVISDYALFASAEYKLTSKMIVKPGVRIAYNTKYRAPVVPMVALRYKKGKFTARGSYSRGFRAPELKELYLSFVDVNHNVIGNPNLKAENSHNFIVSFQRLFFKEKTLAKNFRIFKLEASGFYNHINDRIVLANLVSTQYTYVNVDKYTTLGTNIISTINLGKFRTQLGGSYIGLSNSATNVSGGAPKFTYYPEVRVRTQYDIKKITFNIIYKFNGPQTIFGYDAESEQLVRRRADSYSLFDMNMGGTLWKRKVAWALGVKNIMNVTSINNQLVSSGAHSSGNGSLPIGTGRSYFVRLTYNIPHK